MKKIIELLFGKPDPPQVKELKKIPVSEWAKTWCELNCWRIPKGITKPDWWDSSVGMTAKENRKSVFIRPLMNKIKETIGEKACNREWNRERMTDEEHEQFWKTRHIDFDLRN